MNLHDGHVCVVFHCSVYEYVLLNDTYPPQPVINNAAAISSLFIAQLSLLSLEETAQTVLPLSMYSMESIDFPAHLHSSHSSYTYFLLILSCLYRSFLYLLILHLRSSHLAAML